MAVTLTEQRQAFEDPPLRIKVGSALNVSAQAALAEAGATTNHANRVILAKQVLFASNGIYVDGALRAAIAANASAASLAALLSATDSAIQTAVNTAFDAMANGS